MEIIFHDYRKHKKQKTEIKRELEKLKEIKRNLLHLRLIKVAWYTCDLHRSGDYLFARSYDKKELLDDYLTSRISMLEDLLK